MRKTESGICENLLFLKFYEFTPSKGGGFFACAQNDGVALAFSHFCKFVPKISWDSSELKPSE